MRPPTSPWCPADEAEAAAMVADAARHGTRLEIRGSGSRQGLGDPVIADAILDLERLTGTIAYEPDELVLTVRAATPLAEITALIAGRSQQLAFEPPDFGPLFQRPPGRGTLGGAMAVGIGGPRRLKAGGPRDHLLGFRGINGLGEIIVGGGRVVKNVTGFDLPKLMAGSFGALGVLSEITVKVMPRPQVRCSMVMTGLSETEGLDLLRRAMALPGPVSAGALLPPPLASRLIEDLAPDAAAVLLRFEGVPPSVTAALDALGRDRPPAACRQLDLETCTALWSAVGGGWALARETGAICRISSPPAQAAAVGAAMRAAGVSALQYDSFGGILLVAAPDREGAVDDLRGAVRAVTPDSHLTVLRQGPYPAPAFAPSTPGVAALTRRIKASLDPHGLFNPGRLPGGA
jgi:glycolate oxidase FAD binding subunit